MSNIDWSLYKSDKISITMYDYINLIKKYIDISTIKTIVDAGSLNGADAEILSDAFPGSKGYAIEGLNDNFDLYLKDKTKIVGINRVIASFDGEIEYHQKNINGIHGIYDRGQEYGSLKHLLKCSTLETIMNDFSIQAIDVLKIDVEGATYDVLKSLGDNLQSVQIMHIETETYPFFKGQVLHDTVCRFLDDNNFRLVDISFCEIKPNSFQSDSVWVNKLYFKNNH